MKQKLLLKTMLLLCILVGGASNAWADTSTLSFTKACGGSGTSNDGLAWTISSDASESTFDSTSGIHYGTTNATVKYVTLTTTSLYAKLSGKKITKIVVNARDAQSIASITVSVGSTSFTANKDNPSIGNTSRDFTFDGEAIVGTTDQVSVDVRRSSAMKKAIYVKSVVITYETVSSSTPSISANNVDIAYNATNGSIAYTLANATGNVTASITTGSDWLTLGEITASAVPLTCSANTSTSPRNATVTLSFTGATDKVVTITQAGRPNYISEVIAASTDYTVIGTVVATNNRGFVIGDGTGYVYTYLNATPSQSVGDKVKISGTTGTYGQIIQFTNSATITAETTSAYDGTPAATVINAVPDYSTGLHLSTYLQFEGELEESSSNYYITVGSDQIQISYPTTAQASALSALDGKTVRVKGYFSGNNSSGYFSVMMESAEEVTNPTLSADPATATAFTYTVGNGPSEDQMFTITGTNLVSADITATVSSDYEITDNTDYSSSVTIASGDIVSVRLKAGLAKGTHNGTLTLSSTDATNVVINLSGTVTGQTYAIEQYTAPATAHGTITFSPASPIEDGTEVTLSAEPAEGYTFTANSWVIYKQSGEDYVVDNSVTVTANKFTMPAYAIWVDGTFAAKPTYAITCVASPVAGGTIVSDENAYEGKTVTISCEAASGYELTGIVITKTSDGSATGITPAKSGDDYTFTMPGYAVTATATFLSNTYEGTFALYSGDLTEGDYILVYDGKALKNTVSSNKFGIQSVTPSNNTITDPLRSIVWHIAPSATDGYWTIYNAKADLYANGTEKSTNVSLGDDPTANTAIWAVSGTYDFRCKDNEGQSTARYLRYYDSSKVFGNYASSNGGALTLYKYTTLTPRTITFNGNGGTYNETTTYTQDVYDGVEATLNANKFTRNGYEFIAWNNQADGNGATSCDDGDKITVTGSDLTLYALWAPLYTLTIDNNIDGGSVAVEGNVTSSVEGVEITLSYNPTAGHKFSAWNVYKEGDTSTKVTVTDNKFAMPNYNVVISATFEEVQTYSLVTDVNDIVPGKHYIIASGTNGSVKAIGAQSTNNRTAVSVTATSGIIPETDGVYEFVIYGPDADGYYTIYDETNTKYLYAASSSSNYLKTQGTNDAEGKWNISIANSGSATVKAQGSNTRNWMRNNGDIFSCYGSGQSDIYLYVKDGDTPVATTASVKLNAYGYATFASTSALDFLDADADGVEYSAWQITGVTNNEIAFSQITSSIAAGKGILLKGTPNATINLNILPVGGAALSSNKLTGITTATAIEADTYYGLSGNKFVKVNAGTVKAGKALLPASAITAGARELKFVFEDETTAIRGIENGQLRMENSFFDLQGRKIAQPTKGLYIKNGKKVIVK